MLLLLKLFLKNISVVYLQNSSMRTPWPCPLLWWNVPCCHLWILPPSGSWQEYRSGFCVWDRSLAATVWGDQTWLRLRWLCCCTQTRRWQEIPYHWRSRGGVQWLNPKPSIDKHNISHLIKYSLFYVIQCSQVSFHWNNPVNEVIYLSFFHCSD